jgi:hypothetical protein
MIIVFTGKKEEGAARTAIAPHRSQHAPSSMLRHASYAWRIFRACAVCEKAASAG